MNNSTSLIESEFRRSQYFGRYEFLNYKTELALPCLIILIVASVLGTAGNILILLCVIISKSVRKVEGIFIVNLAISDLYVTLIADPMSIVAKLEGEQFFARFSRLCQAIASLCTISCVTSLMTIAAMSCNRYFYICAQRNYEKVFTKRNSILYCISFYLVGCILVLLNSADIGDHGFDRKSLECIWDRMATYPYTVIFSVTLVWIPSCVTGFCYLKIFMYVRKHSRRVRDENQPESSILFMRKINLTKTLFIIYAVFVTCWVPYALLIVLDTNDNFPHEIHLFITTFAHLHPSINWLIYLLTNKKFADAFKRLFLCCTFQNIGLTINASGNINRLNHNKVMSVPKPKENSMIESRAIRICSNAFVRNDNENLGGPNVLDSKC